MSFSAQSFLKTYGTVGVTVYGSVTLVSMTSIYWAVRTMTTNEAGDLDEATIQTRIVSPMEKVLGSDSKLVQSIQHQLQQAMRGGVDVDVVDDVVATGDQKDPSTLSANDPTRVITITKSTTTTTTTTNSGINWKREGAYFGVATLVDSLILPIKLVVCLPIAKYLLKRRGGGGGGAR
jgi:hypothetical protein